jgi:hypothetical protein
MFTTREIARRQIGTRTILGTNHPVVTTVVREQLSSERPLWIVTYGICNGIASDSEVFHTRREALEAFNG